MSGRTYAGRLARLEALETERREREAGSLADRLHKAVEQREGMTAEQRHAADVLSAQQYIEQHSSSADPLVARLVRAYRRALAYLNGGEAYV